MSVELEIGLKQKVPLKNSYLTFVHQDPISGDMARVIGLSRHLAKKFNGKVRLIQ